MDRRRALKITAGTLAGGGAASLLALTTAFKPKVPAAAKPQRLKSEKDKSVWAYSPLEPVATAELAYQSYNEGSCMYAVTKGVISQLAEKFGEPYSSFPIHMMKYGHGGVGGFGTLCGALNGAAALVGLFVYGKNRRDALIKSLFCWYEGARLPAFSPQKSLSDFTPLNSVSNSTLCHASTTNWCKKHGYQIKSKQRKERCRRLTADVADRTVTVLNQFFRDAFTTSAETNDTVRTCMTCHGQNGKLADTGSKMNCSSCHTEPLGHRIFADIHYKLE